MKLLEHFLGVLCAFCLMIIFLITSVEAVAYWTPGYYEHEYSKYNVTEAVRMEMDDLLEVTDEMMAYLRGDRPVFPHHRRAGRAHIHRLHEIFRDFPPYFL